MITAIEIENLKCFSVRQRVELAPITLLYGANNSGKSTAMYALLLFGQWLESQLYNFGPLHLTDGGKDLGPSCFATYNHNNSEPITIRVEFSGDESEVFNAIEICVKPSPNDIRGNILRSITGDKVQLVRIRCERNGKFIGGSWDNAECQALRIELLEDISTHRIIGALRDLPPANFISRSPHTTDRSEWFRGVAAWNRLGYMPEDQLIWTNQWLGPEYLDLGVEIVQQRLVESYRLADLLSDRFPQGKNLSHNELSTCLQEIYLASERQVRVRPLQGKEICGSVEPLLWPNEVGVGVSQLLPIVVACMNRNGSFFMIQEPETHVHPRLQARIGDLLIDSTADHLGYGIPNQLMIESHSEHLLHRLKRRIRESTRGTAPQNLEISADRVAINYFSQVTGSSRVERIHVDVNGEFVEPWPDDFFDLDFIERFS